MKFLPKIRSLSPVFLIVAALLAACSDESTTEKIVEVTSSGVDVVSDISMLPDCGKSNDRELVWVKGETTPRMCSEGKWYAVAEGSVSATCFSEPLADGSGIKVMCGGDSIGVLLNGVDGKVADLVIPLCSNVHLAGSMTNMVVYAAGLAVLAGEALPFGAFTEYILMVSVTAVASPGVPGGVVLACASVAEAALGFSAERYAIMIALYMALDGMGTACNLTGDGAIAIVVDKFRSRSASPAPGEGSPRP